MLEPKHVQTQISSGRACIVYKPITKAGSKVWLYNVCTSCTCKHQLDRALELNKAVEYLEVAHFEENLGLLTHIRMA